MQPLRKADIQLLQLDMRLLLDANLSPKIVRRIATAFPECLHMFNTGLTVDARDIDIWSYARENDFTLILTYDEDFSRTSWATVLLLPVLGVGVF